MLRGRERECGTLDRLVADIRRRHGGALVLRGDRGAGKTVLLERLARGESSCRVVRAVGVQQEMDLPFAGLHQLCASLLDSLDRLPEPRRDALATAFGMRGGPAPPGFLVSLAALGLLVEAAAERPLLCLIDDAQWLDRASADVLGFVARRVGHEQVGLVLAATSLRRGLHGLPTLTVGGLARADACALLRSAVAGPLDERIAERLADETQGNPRALLELSRGLTAAELAGGFGVPRTITARRPCDASTRRIHALPADTRQLLLIAAAEPVGDARLVRRAAAELGVGPDAVDAAAGLAEFNGHVRFRHPRIRSAIYALATADQRSAAHRALAAATDPAAAPEMRAWHHALATAGPDDAVADELERSAGRAQAHGGFPAAGAFLERATALTSTPSKHAARALAAARMLHRAGAVDAMLHMLAVADAGPLSEVDRAQADLLRAQAIVADGGDAEPLLLQTARRIQPLAPQIARDCYLEAYGAALGAGSGGATIAADARAAAGEPSPDAGGLLLDGLTRRWSSGFAAGADANRRAVREFVHGRATREDELSWLPLATRVAVDLWDYEAWDALSARQYVLARETGALGLLPDALDARIGVRVVAGDLAGARALADELTTIAAVAPNRLTLDWPLVVAAWSGGECDTAALTEGAGPGTAGFAAALAHNARGDYAEALRVAERAAHGPYAAWALCEFVEAAVRTGDRTRAELALVRLTATTDAADTDWARGAQAVAEALVLDGPSADARYRAAIECLARARLTGMLARAQLLYGEWLRRERRRRDARDMLLRAHGTFTALGAHAFAERCARELRAAGKNARARKPELRDGLTEREQEIARFAGAGLANAEIGTRLFISPRTVEYHLSKIFAKLEISSRAQIADAIPEDVRRAPLPQPSG
ncbi:AAA family ATPase [Solirubrobacter ginsenosidimutans]|uniref:AAA family ATPase n=1 Tax=Solirubrobacter ginsenosidimutans TaxID=490573 RepID=A0A9X3S297_9ACTN|nr:helix-turn-helix transcriptional regulator [Solirubrobacter ginsenosidimutans]MDA0164340.1 AAA family ATPase [Solirubrobacter ginsenosidimutans]